MPRSLTLSLRQPSYDGTSICLMVCECVSVCACVCVCVRTCIYMSVRLIECRVKRRRGMVRWRGVGRRVCVRECVCVCVCVCVQGRGDKSELGKGFLMQRTPLPASIFCQGSVKDESPLGNSTSPQHSRTTPQVTHTHTHTHTRARTHRGLTHSHWLGLVNEWIHE